MQSKLLGACLCLSVVHRRHGQPGPTLCAAQSSLQPQSLTHRLRSCHAMLGVQSVHNGFAKAFREHSTMVAGSGDPVKHLGHRPAPQRAKWEHTPTQHAPMQLPCAFEPTHYTSRHPCGKAFPHLPLGLRPAHHGLQEPNGRASQV